MELVTGKAGKPHVSSADDGRRIAGEVGSGSYVLATGGRCAPSLVDSNTIRIATGDLILQGRHVGITGPEDVKVASGTQGKKRRDYVCVRYKRDVGGRTPTLVETVEWTVLRGTPGDKPAAPSVPSGSIMSGDADVTIPVASVDFDGLTTKPPALLIPVLKPLADVWDSVSPVESTVFEGLKVYGSARGGSATLTVEGSGVYTQRDKRAKIAQLKPGFAPRAYVRVLFGVAGSAWGIIEVGEDGAVYVNHQYGPDSYTWAYVFSSVTFTY